MRKMKEGVKYSKSKNSWISVFTDNNDKYHELYFSVKKYGDDTQRIAEQCFNLKRDIRKNEYLYDKDMYGEGSETIENDNKCNSDKENKVS